MSRYTLEKVLVDYRYTSTVLDSESEETQLSREYQLARNAGFRRIAEDVSIRLEELKIKQKNLKLLEKWRAQGYLTLVLPEMIHRSRRNIWIHVLKQSWWEEKNNLVLAKIPIDNFVGQVPLNVMQIAIEHKNNFTELSILMIGQWKEVKHLAYRQIVDPLLIGTWDGPEAVVLAWWGKDLNQLDAFFKKHRGLHRTPTKEEPK